jgi:hypothetical protein
LVGASLWAIASPQPDVLVTDDGQTVAIRGPDGRLSILRSSRDSFAVKEWLAADADARTPKDASLNTGVTCDAVGCIGKLADAGFVLAALEAAMALQVAPADPARADREQAIAKLEGGRKEMLAMVRSGDMTRDEFRAEMAILEADVRALEALVPTAAPAVDPQQLAALVVSVFAEFAFLSFVQQRNVLRGALRGIIVDASARAITTVTISGGYLGRGVNSVLPSRAQFQIDAIQDLTIRLPHPVVIAATYVDRRTANGYHPNTVAAQYKAVA